MRWALTYNPAAWVLDHFPWDLVRYQRLYLVLEAHYLDSHSFPFGQASFRERA